jgi:hypothetical protein
MMKNGSSISTSTNSKTVRKTYQGRCLAILRPLGSPGDIHLRAEADGLELADTTVTAR